MFESGQNWELFGYDMRNLGRHFAGAWRDLLWAYDSPIRSRLDQPVILRSTEGDVCYQASQPGVDQVGTDCTAVLLPENLVLSKTLRLPVAVETELEDVVALEVSANSPFSGDDTGFGWSVLSRDDQYIQVVLVIVSLSASMTYIAQEIASHSAHAQEAWANVQGRMIVVRGFGEGKREAHYKRRMIKVGASLAIAAVMLLLMAAVGAGFKKLELDRLQGLASTTQKEAANASQMRATLVAANETIAAVAAITRMYPSAHSELSRLTRLLGDDVFVERLSISGNQIDLRGKAADAAAVMELLTEQEGYAAVTAASAIRKIPGSSIEQFHLKVQLSGSGE